MIRRTPLRRAPFKRPAIPMGPRKRPPRTKYAARERDTPRMMFVKTAMACSVALFPPLWCPDPTPCGGVIEADHMLDDHGLSHKGHDDGVAPMCHDHHHERTNGYGTFKLATKLVEREWRERALDNARIHYHLAAELLGGANY